MWQSRSVWGILVIVVVKSFELSFIYWVALMGFDFFFCVIDSFGIGWFSL